MYRYTIDENLFNGPYLTYGRIFFTLYKCTLHMNLRDMIDYGKGAKVYKITCTKINVSSQKSDDLQLGF